MNKIRTAFAAAAACGVMVLSACGGSGGGGTEAVAPDGSLEKTQITVGVLPLADYGAVYWANENGLFEKEGLEVTLEPIQGGPIGIQKVASGELDYAIANTISASISQAQGAPVTDVAYTASLGNGSGAIFVKPDSPIQTIDDLNGKTVGTNTTRNIGDVTFANLARSEGKKVSPNWVEVPFPEMVSGVQAGSIDAGYTPEPFWSAAQQAGMRRVVDLTNGPNAGLAASIFVAGNRFVGQNPDTTAAFARAIYAAGGEMAADEQAVRNWIPSVAKVPADVAQTMVMPTYSSGMDVAALEKVSNMLKEQGLIPADFDISDHVYQLPTD
ncbi:ABC transporter substrate-binding protein [Gordonia sp. ABSL11-1]|uniref:ABC transporter substrate-binding protein n=1 Tax=Gordonia sp. ABSL11-1 TaxID=3053924 RepID=UPI0025732F5F|nr:ABC transporter substrate-binding protein [Gordonia sp. ABSL11-1]MDL9947171.1 ABC transporter substrate-binding protein [Gordonia sp. ABSL11-1]